METNLTIGKVAAAAGVNVETIRFYQRRGILLEPPKKLGGLRYYDQATVEKVRFIKRAQTLGFTLDEVIALLALQKSNACAETRNIARKKLQLVEERIHDLERMRTTLKVLIGQCTEGGSDVSCPIIASLSHRAPLGTE